MKLLPLLEKIRLRQPNLVTPFVLEYFQWADVTGDNKPYFYGKWSLKWALSVISPHLTDGQLRTLVHHIVSELAIAETPEETAQYNAVKMSAMAPYRNFLNEVKNLTDVASLPSFHAGGFKFVVNNTTDNLSSMILRRTNADAIVFVNPEHQSAGITIRVNSKLNLLTGFKEYLRNTLPTEPGWNITNAYTTVVETNNKDNSDLCQNMFINYGQQTKTPTSHTVESITQIINNYFKL